VVNAADYTAWRNNLGSLTSLPNDPTPGVDQEDYNAWKSNFGATSTAGSLSNSAVPEPAPILPLSLAVLGAVMSRRSSRQFGRVNHLRRPEIDGPV